MKTTLTVIGFISASVLAGIGVEDFNTVAMIAGLFLMVLSFALVLTGKAKKV